jgi:hypothetical protein
MSSSCKQFDGKIVTDERMEKARDCLKLAFLYIDRTVDPPVFRYIKFDDSYEITGWRKEENKIYFTVRLKDGTVFEVNNNDLKNIDLIVKFKKSLRKS